MPNHMKTLHITNAFHSASGGVATSFHALLAEANKAGRPMRLVVPSDRDYIEEAGDYGRIYHVAAPHSILFDRRYRTILPHRYLIGRSGAIWDILKAEQPDLLEVCDKFCLNWIGGLFRKGWHRGVKRPVLVGWTTERMDDQLAAYISRSAMAAEFARWYMRYCYTPLFDYHIANSSYTADEIRGCMAARHSREVLVCTHGVDCASFHPARRDAATRQRLLKMSGGDHHSLLLLYSGRLAREKNIGLLVDLMARLNSTSDCDYRLIIAGQGPMAAWLATELTRRSASRFVFLGHVADKSALARLYASCDVFIHPNPREPFGIAPLEAMASGLALVAPSSGGVLSYADQSNSWPVPADPASFHQAIIEAAPPEIRMTRTLAARRTAEQFDWPIVAARMFNIYDRLIETRFGAGGEAVTELSCVHMVTDG
ncbi:MAG TPA: glycosyltransferase [Blastocatellia bacterium]|nr:glycosyltransferase [Blastocatellia bacterium]